MLNEVGRVKTKDARMHYLSSAHAIDEEFALTEHLGITYVPDGIYFTNVLGCAMMDSVVSTLALHIDGELPTDFWLALESRINNPFEMLGRYRARLGISKSERVSQQWAAFNQRAGKRIYTSRHELSLRKSIELACADFVEQKVTVDIDPISRTGGAEVSGGRFDSYFKQWGGEIKAANKIIGLYRTDINTGLSTPINKLDYAKYPWQALRHFRNREME